MSPHDPRVPAGPVRAHIQDLVAQGMTQAAIVKAADASSACVSSLIHGQFNPARTPVQTIDADTANRLLAVELKLPRTRLRKILCDPGERFTIVGWRVGQCDECGQLAPIQRLTAKQGLREVLVRHQRLDGQPRDVTETAQPMAELPAPNHPDCGSTRGLQRHRREKTEPCGPCRYTMRGYDAGYKAAIARVRREAMALAIPQPLVEAVVVACRGFVLRRPVPQLREMAIAVVRQADAELADEGEQVAA